MMVTTAFSPIDVHFSFLNFNFLNRRSSDTKNVMDKHLGCQGFLQQEQRGYNIMFLITQNVRLIALL